MVRLALLLTGFFLGLAAAVAQERRSVAPTVLEQIRQSPLVFYVARGEPDVCGPGCSEWIAAEGAFDRDAAVRFRKFLDRHRGQRLPVFFHSTGGLVAEAQAIGAMMRERRLVAGVAKTLPEACQPNAGGAVCEAAKKSAGKLKAEWTSVDAVCNSACVYALVGAPTRSVMPGSRIGIHSSKIVCMTMQGGRIVNPDARGPKCAERAIEAKVRLQRYLRRMGVKDQLLEAVAQVPHNELRLLTRDEIARFGIDRREFQESPWSERSGASPAIWKFVSVTRGPDRTGHRAGAIQLQCHYSSRVIVSYYRAIGIDGLANTAKVTMVAGEHRFDFPSAGVTSRFEYLERGGWFERLQLSVPLAFLDAAAVGTTIRVEEAGEVAHALELSTIGLQRIWTRLRTQCSVSTGLEMRRSAHPGAVT